MESSDKRYYIMDTRGSHYKLSNDNNLVFAKNSSEATTFTLHEANLRIGIGKKAKFYTVLGVEETPIPVQEVASDEVNCVAEHDTATKPTMFDTLQNNWEEKLSELCYLSSHISEYQAKLNQMLSEVDKEISDILHYIEFNNPDDEKLLMASKMLQERRRRRREIKNEMEKTVLMRETFLDSSFGIKVHQSLEQMERMKGRIYTPRKLSSLFGAQVNGAITQGGLRC